MTKTKQAGKAADLPDAPTVTDEQPPVNRMAAFFDEQEIDADDRPVVSAALDRLLKDAIARLRPDPAIGDAEAEVAAAIAEIEQLLADQLDAVLHAPEVQAALNPWFGLQYLVEQTAGQALKLSVLQMSPADLTKDVRKDVGKSALAKLLGHDAIGTDGKAPVSLLQVDQEFGPGQPDVKALGFLGALGRQFLFAVVAPASPRLYGGRTYADMLPPDKLIELHTTDPGFSHWRALRKSDDSLPVFLVGNRVLGRSLYGPEGRTEDGLEFYAETARTDGDLPWVPAATVVSVLAGQSLGTFRWARVTGKRAGGAAPELPLARFNNDPAAAPRLPVEVQVNNEIEKAASDLGIPVLYGKAGTTEATFFQIPAVHAPAASADKQLSEADNLALTKAGQLRANLAVCINSFLVGQLVKGLTFEYLGGETDRETLQEDLNALLNGMVLIHRNKSTAVMKAKRPLDGAAAVVRDTDKDGWYEVDLFLHFPSNLNGLKGCIKVRGKRPVAAP